MLLSIVCFSERERDTDTATPRPKRCVDGELSKRCHAAAQGEPSRPNSLSSPCRPGKRGGGPIDDYGHGANTERGGGRNVPHSGYVERFPPLLFLSLSLPRLELCLMDRVSFEGGLNPLFPQPVSGVAASHLPGAQKRQRRGKELDIQAFPEVEGFPPRWPLSPFPLPPSLSFHIALFLVDLPPASQQHPPKPCHPSTRHARPDCLPVDRAVPKGEERKAVCEGFGR